MSAGVHLTSPAQRSTTAATPLPSSGSACSSIPKRVSGLSVPKRRIASVYAMRGHAACPTPRCSPVACRQAAPTQRSTTAITGKRHLQVQLSKLQLTVGAAVLVTIAACLDGQARLVPERTGVDGGAPVGSSGRCRLPSASAYTVAATAPARNTALGRVAPGQAPGIPAPLWHTLRAGTNTRKRGGAHPRACS